MKTITTPIKHNRNVHGYTYMGLHEWLAYADPEDYWNEHHFIYEATFQGEYVAIKPDLTGWADGRLQFEVAYHGGMADVRWDPYREMWVFRDDSDERRYACLTSIPGVPVELANLLFAAVRSCRGYREEEHGRWLY